MIFTKQLTLGLPYRSTFDREDFIVAPCNADAVTWLDLYPHWSAHALLIHGPAGCGKTHLSHIFTRNHISARDLHHFDDSIHPNTPRLVVEHIDETTDETELFHLFNWTCEQGIGLLMTARRVPTFHLPDLASRMALVQKIEILPPDDELIYAVLGKAFAERNILVDTAVLEYAVRQTERSFPAIQALINGADNLSLEQNRRITIPIIKQVLADLKQKKSFAVS